MNIEKDKLQSPQSVTLSVIIVVASDTIQRQYDFSHMVGCLETLELQHDAPAMEIIVPYPVGASDPSALQQRFKQVRFIPIHDLKRYKAQGHFRDHHDELRARGLPLARGEYIALLEDYDRVHPCWSREMIAAHGQACAGVGGAIENGIDRTLNWAVFLCDFGKYQNPLPSGETKFASDVNISYKRSALAAIQPVWEESFVETEVNAALVSSGRKLIFAPSAVVYQHRTNLRLISALQERFAWGRSYAASRSKSQSTLRRGLYALLSPLLPGLLLLRIAASVVTKRRDSKPFVKALPLTLMLLAFWSTGEMVGYIGGHAQTSNALSKERIAPI
jgi:hypothetical protein